MSKALRSFAALVGTLLVIVGAVYLFTPANALPSYLPGYDPALTKMRYKHGLGSLVLGVGLLAYAWPERRGGMPGQGG